MNTNAPAEYRTWRCLICGYLYDEANGIPEAGIPAGAPWQDIPINWVCPDCAARKEDFEMLQL